MSEADQRALLKQYCVTCHSERLKTGGLVLESIDPGQVSVNAALLEKIVRKVRSGRMPPDGQPRPDHGMAIAFASTLERALDRAADARPNPGSLPVHRLNRLEYANAIRDMLALEINASALLPSDDSAFGFDNNAETLSMSPALMARYMSAATKISRIALGSRDTRPTIEVYKPPPFARQEYQMGPDLPFGTIGGLAVRHAFPLEGEYDFRIRLQGGGTLAESSSRLEMRIDHERVREFEIGGEFKGKLRDGDGGGPALPEDDVVGRQVEAYRQNIDRDLKVRLPIKAGVRLVAVAFVDMSPSATEGAAVPVTGLRTGAGGVPLGVESVEVAGPFGGSAPEDTPMRRRILICRPAGVREEPCARAILMSLARRAFRRPVSASEIEPLLATYRAGRKEADFDRGIEHALETLLTMPSFLLRVETPPAGLESGRIYRLSGLELASRLSFFLWRSVPDDRLIGLAVRGTLHEPHVLTGQVRRMLADLKATRWMSDFVGQWLIVRNMHTVEPDPRLFAEFDDSLREAMVKETELFFESQVRDDRPIAELLTAQYTFLNERLATHYGVPGVFGSHFRRVRLNDERRHGLLGHASVLTVTSYAHRTSVVLRGKWVLETLLGAPPPPPPPNVPPLKENDGHSAPASLRERMEQHRRNAICASCHSAMDPLGFALEHFDATGRWRDTDEGMPINAAITLNGEQIDGPRAFREALSRRTDEFLRTVTEKLLTYSLGRGLDHHDAPAVRQIMRQAARDNYTWSALIRAIVNSRAFQMSIVPDTEPMRLAQSDEGVAKP